MFYYPYSFPAGTLWLTAAADALIGVLWSAPAHGHACETPLIAMAAGQLNEYFAGSRTCFDLPLRTNGSRFQQCVWDALRQIPYGQTRTYGQIARIIDTPSAARAVGMACNRNPLPIIIPCHRVIASSGNLTGYAHGIDTKKLLLDIERS